MWCSSNRHSCDVSLSVCLSHFSLHIFVKFSLSVLSLRLLTRSKILKKKEKGRWTDNESNVTPKSKILLPAMAQPPRPLWSSSSIMFVIISRTIGASPWAQAQTSDVIEYIQLSPSRRRRRGKVFYFIFYFFFHFFHVRTRERARAKEDKSRFERKSRFVRCKRAHAAYPLTFIVNPNHGRDPPTHPYLVFGGYTTVNVKWTWTELVNEEGWDFLNEDAGKTDQTH